MFVNTRLLSPVVYNGMTTAPKNSYEYNRWWDEERDRCLNGFSAGDTSITGAHYFYLNHWKIRAKGGDQGARKGLRNPMFLDIDHEYFWEVKKARDAGEDLLIFKRRQTGHSYKSGCLVGYEATFFPDSYSIITAGEDKFADKTYKDCKTGLDRLAGTEFYKNRIINNADEMLFGYEEEINGVKHRGGYLSTIRNIVAKDPQALVGTSPSLVLYEEIGMFPKLSETKGYTDPAMENNGIKTGFSLLIGTGGEANKSIDEVTKMFYDPVTYGLRAYDNTYDDEDFVEVDDAPRRDLRKICLFVPGYKYWKVDAEGNSLIEASKLDLIERRKKLEKDKSAWLKEVTQYPMTPDEGLMVPDGNMFNAQKLRAQLGQILRYQENIDRLRLGDIDWVRDDANRIIGAEWIDYDPNNESGYNGRFRMTEAPYIDPVTKKVPKGVYVAGTDSYDKDKIASVNGSFGSMYMMKTFINLDQDADIPVCSLTERPPTAAEFYEDTAKMCVLYGYGMNLIEHSNLLIGDWYLRNGFVMLLKERPSVAYATNIMESKSENKWGAETTTKPYWLQAAADYVEEHVHKIWDPELIRSLLKYRNAPDYNCDRTIAFSLAVTHIRDVIHLRSKPKEETLTPFSLRYVKQGERIIRL